MDTKTTIALGKKLTHVSLFHLSLSPFLFAIRLTLFAGDDADAFASPFLTNERVDECTTTMVDCGIKSGLTFVTEHSSLCDMDSSTTPDVVPCSAVDASGE